MNFCRFSHITYSLKKIFIVSFIFGFINLFLSEFLFSQNLDKTSNQKNGWTTVNPFQTDVFVENQGQFNSWAKSSLPIKYAINHSDQVFFTPQGVIFRLEKFENSSEKEREQREKEGVKDTTKRIFYVTMNWVGCNPNTGIIASEQSEGYYTFGEKGFEKVKAKGFRKLLYSNLYPGIDVEYTIPKKGGIKYKLIIHPGAVADSVKMCYTGDVEGIYKDKEGNIVIQTPAGDITDHAPESIIKETKAIVPSSFLLNSNIVSFSKLPTPNFYAERSRSTELFTLEIDPWTTTPVSLDSNYAALDLDFDNYGNVYVSGGTTPFKLAKYSNTGALLWTFTNPVGWCDSLKCYSKFCVIPGTGTSYIGEGFVYGISGRIMKIYSSGLLSYTSSPCGANNEIWRMYYNNCTKQLIAFGGGTNSNHNIKIMADTNLSSCSSKNFNGATSFGNNDMAVAEMDNNGDFYALMTSVSTWYPVEGRLQKSTFSTNYSPPCAFDVQTNYEFQEGQTLQGISGNMFTCRANAMAINGSYIFTYDGKTLHVWNKTNGILLDSIVANNGYFDGKYRTHEGIDADQCNTVYVGGTNKVHVYSFNGSFFTTLPTISANITGEVRDIKLNSAFNKLYVCGQGFVTESITPVSCISGSLSTTVSVDSCLGNICITAAGGIPPYSYQWSNGSTGNCIVGVPTTAYFVTITDNSCTVQNHVDTISYSSFLHVAITPSNPTVCSGDTVTLLALSDKTGTVYNWSNGSAGSSISVAPTTTATYSVIGENDNCYDTVSVTVIVTTINSSISGSAQICRGESITLHASGGTTYYWMPPYGLLNPSSNSPIATPDSTITYYVTIINGNCVEVDSVKIIVECPVVYFPNSFTPNDDGINDVFFAKGEFISDFSIIVFNRWGEEMFKSNDISRGWNGSYKGKECDQAIYTFAAKITFTNGEGVIKRGAVTLIR